MNAVGGGGAKALHNHLANVLVITNAFVTQGTHSHAGYI